MAISEKKIIPLSIEKCEAFKPKKEKENSLKCQKPEIDLNLIEEDEQLLKFRDIPRRKSSTGSTSASRPDDTSEFISFPSSPINSAQESQQSGIFFGRDRNCSNPVFNFYQNTEDNLRETYPDKDNYKKTKNYMLKEKYFKINENPKEKTIKENNIPAENLTQNNNIFKNSFQATPVAAVMPFTPKIYSGGKGKFDLPMYYLGFYGWDTSNGIPMIPYTTRNNFNQKNEKKTENSGSTSFGEGEDSSKKENKNESLSNHQENIEPTMMIGTPIFFSNIPKYCYNKIYKKKQKPFTEREGDWICNNCKNLNFAFRVECNRCKLPKGADAKTNSNDENNKENNLEQKPYQKSQRNNKHKKSYNYYYNNKNNGNESGKE